MPKAFITGTAGFIGFHLANELLDQGWDVAGFDGMTPYYDVTLKQQRHAMLQAKSGFTSTEGMLEDDVALNMAIDAAEPNVIVHLAAQAGVRYCMENPRAYIDANLVGTFNVLEAARRTNIGHLLMASTSSVYGANEDLPFDETQKTETPLNLYAATKKANEAMAHSYAHMWDMPITMFRFFSVFGTWGRPDLALFKFVQAALNGQPIDVYNHGNMSRDFTYVGDLVKSIRLLIDAKPGTEPVKGDTLSPVAPYRVVNIGNGEQVSLMHFINIAEEVLGIPIQKNMLPMQVGDVPATWANADLLEALTGYKPNTDVREGITAFINWYRAYYGASITEPMKVPA